MRTKSNPVDGNWDHQIERAVGQWMSAHNGLYPDLCLVEPWVQKQLFRDPRAIRHMRVDPGNKERLYYRGMELRVGCAPDCECRRAWMKEGMRRAAVCGDQRQAWGVLRKRRTATRQSQAAVRPRFQTG
jgi:hypothetical protein